MPEHRPNLPPAASLLSDSLKEVLSNEQSAVSEWIAAYKKIHANAAGGKHVSAKDINQIDEKLSKALNAADDKLAVELNRTVREELNDMAASRTSAAPTSQQHQNRHNQTFVQTLIRKKQLQDQYYNVRTAMMQGLLGTNETLNMLDDVAALNRAFQKLHIAKSKHKENVQIEPLPRDEHALIRALLDKNRGVAIGDIHTSAKAPRYITEHLADFKKAGVDTLYIEFGSSSFDKLNTFSVPELKQLIEKRHYAGFTLATPEQIAQRNGTAQSDDVVVEWVKMIALMRESGIRVVNIDKKDPGRDVEAHTSMMHRITTTNFTWTDVIEKDRKALEVQGKKGGKFIVFGGISHFLESGMVDEALGIPVVVFTREGETPMPAVMREYSQNGPDFYLNGGKHYRDEYKVVRAADMENIAGALKKLNFLPAVPLVRFGLETMANQYRIETDQYRFESADTKGPEGVPSAPSPASTTIAPRKQTR